MILRKSLKFNSEKLPYKTLCFMWQTTTEEQRGRRKSRPECQKNAKAGGLADGCMDTVRWTGGWGAEKLGAVQIGRRKGCPLYHLSCLTPPQLAMNLHNERTWIAFYFFWQCTTFVDILPPCQANPLDNNNSFNFLQKSSLSRVISEISQDWCKFYGFDILASDWTMHYGAIHWNRREENFKK